MARPAGGDGSPETLRIKYAELTRKYHALVERLERRATHDLAIYRLGAFGLRITGAALALVTENGIQVSNARFVQLVRTIQGPLIAAEPENAPPYPDLRALVIAWSSRMLRDRLAAVELQYRDSSSDALLSLRLERNVQATGPTVVVLAEDLSEHARRDRELVRTRETVLNRERLRVLGELAASIAHDLGNTLRGASFQLTAVRENSVPPKERAQALNAVEQRIEIASEAIARLHDFARTGAVGLSVVRLDRVIEKAAALLDIEFHSGEKPVNVVTSIPELPPVRGSLSELSLMFVNLLRNARDAMPNGGTVRIVARQQASSVIVTVADEGSGIPAAVHARLFEPFFTTKGPRGTGLGLWLAAGTMERLGGSIRAVKRPGKGALFALTFPVRATITRGVPRPSAESPRAEAPREPSAPAPRQLRRGRRSG
jgi:signal transduction histidine kinase